MALKKSTKEAKEAEVVKETKVKKVSAKDVKKSAAKTVAAAKQTATDLRNLTEAELQKALATAKEDLQLAQKMLKANELPASHVIRSTKKQIARIHSVLTEKLNEKMAEKFNDKKEEVK